MSVPLSPELDNKVRAAAKLRGMSRSEFIRKAVLDALIEQGSRNALRMRARSSS
jgi:metal-responsive CopG/Arc/MetJ family transcriptional regulator